MYKQMFAAGKCRLNKKLKMVCHHLWTIVVSNDTCTYPKVIVIHVHIHCTLHMYVHVSKQSKGGKKLSLFLRGKRPMQPWMLANLMTMGTQVMLGSLEVKGEATLASVSDREIPVWAVFSACREREREGRRETVWDTDHALSHKSLYMYNTYS